HQRVDQMEFARRHAGDPAPASGHQLVDHAAGVCALDHEPRVAGDRREWQNDLLVERVAPFVRELKSIAVGVQPEAEIAPANRPSAREAPEDDLGERAYSTA